MHSALKKDGKALYEYAREGEKSSAKPRDVTIYELELARAHDPRATSSYQNHTCTCSKGTYIRTLGEDIGEALGCGAHLASLRRHRDRRLRPTASASRWQRWKP